MQAILKKENILKVKGDLLVLPVFKKRKALFLEEFPTQLRREIIVSYLRNKFWQGELGETRVLSTNNQIKAKNILILGLGKEEELSLETLRRASAVALKAAQNLNLKSLLNPLPLLFKKTKESRLKKFSEESVVQALTEGSFLANYVFDRFKSKKEKREISSLIFFVPQITSLVKKALNKGIILAEATNYVRDLVNLPASIATPSYLAKESEKLKEARTTVKIYSKKEIEKKGMRALLAVSAGSAEEPKFIFIRYSGCPGGKKIALVGKGITFDAGGLNLKPTRYIEEMKQDMSGAATVLGVIKAAQQLKLKINLLGFIPTCENLLGAKAYKPGDILVAYNKKTIEVINTDAEGRLILADGLSFAEEQKPDLILDIATLTGAVIVALGKEATGLLSKNEKLIKKLTEAGEISGERVWPLPLWDEYKELVRSEIADIANVHQGFDAGTIEGAVFLSNFVKKTPWAHLDIAGTAFRDKEKYYLKKGATGVGVRLLITFLENLENKDFF